MTQVSLIQNLGIIVISAALMSWLARRIRMPTIVAYLFAGLAIGPMTGLVEINHALELISEMGIALLLFIVGLELNLDRVRSIGRVAVVAGIGQVVFTFVVGYALTWLFGFSFIECAFLSTALTFSSTVVVVKLLDEKKDMHRLYGRIAVGIFLVQDLVAIVMLTFLAGLAAGEEGGGAGGIALGVLHSFAGMAVLLGAALAAARWILPRPFAWAAHSPETSYLWSLCWCFLALLAAKGLGLSLEIGAFLAGVSLAQLPFNGDIRIRLHPLMSFFIAVFFVSLGVRMDLSAAAESSFTVIVLSLFVLIGNPFIFIWIICRMGYSERTSFYTGVTVAQISEFSFILVAMGVSAGIVSPDILSLTAIIGLITISLSAYFIIYNRPLYEWCRDHGWLRLFRASKPEDDQAPPPALENHLLVIGMNTLGRHLARRLTEAGETVLAIDNDPRKLRELPCATMLGNADYRAVLEEAGLERAKFVVSALRIEDANDLLAYRCRAAEVPFAATVMDLDTMDRLLDMDAAYLITPKIEGMKLVKREFERLGILPA